MTIRATVHQGRIELPPGVELREGTEVEVVIPDGAPEIKAAPAEWPEWLRQAYGSALAGIRTDDIMRLTRGED